MRKQFLLLLLLTLPLTPALAQCTFISPTVELNSVHTDINGNCVVNFNLGFEIDINNGNKIIFVHLWRTADYNDFNYGTQNQPKETNVLADAIATVIIDNEYLLDHPNAPASQVFQTSYGPDPGIDDNIGAAQQQVKDASDGLTYNQVVVNAAANTYRYTINNLELVLPGACSNQISFTGDAWSSNGNSASSSVQCTMEGYSFTVNDPVISTAIQCRYGGAPNQYQVDISTNSTLNLEFQYDVYGDNGDGFFDQTLDQLLVSNAGPFTITHGSPYNSGLLNVPAPFGNTDPFRQRSLWVRTEGMKLINNASFPPVVTAISNLLLGEAVNPGCIPLPVHLSAFSVRNEQCKAVLSWATASEQDTRQFVVQRGGNGQWTDIGTVPAAGSSSTVRNYQFTDAGVSNGSRYEYRLKQVDFNNTVAYSATAPFKALCSGTDVSLHPNPVSDRVTLQLNGQGQEIEVYDAAGRRMLRKETGESTELTINTALWPGGLYQVLVLDKGTVHSRLRFVKN